MTPRFASLLVITAFVGLNLLYVAVLCPFDLSPDEAHYWDWSRHLDICYYSKGPLIAWLIRGSCELFGNTQFGVRFPAALSGGILLAGLFQLCARSTGNPRLALGVILVAMTLPPVSVDSVLMTIDPPFLACWVWATLLMLPDPRRESVSGVSPTLATLAGLLVSLGTLAKLTMLLFPLCIFGWMLARKRPITRSHLAFFGCSTLGLIPLIWWNATHDWLGLHHLLGHGGAGAPVAGVVGFGTFLGGQLGLLLGVWFVFWVLAVCRYPRREELAFLWWLSVPVFGIFCLASLRKTGQPNWPVPAYLSGTVLVAIWVSERWGNRYVRRSVVGAILIGLAGGLALRFPNALRPTLAQLVPAPNEDKPAPIRMIDPTARLLGWKHLASRVDVVRDRVLAETGADPVLVGMTWIVPGELGFYCRGNPVVYSFGAVLGDRMSQYDLWYPNPLEQAQEFSGRAFVYVGERFPEPAFDSMELAEAVVAWDNDIPVANWKIWVCRGYRGFDSPKAPKPPVRY